MISLHAHQVPHVAKLVKIIRERNAAHDGSDAGTGKTICAAMIAKELGVEALVICPKSVAPFWDKILAAIGVTGTAINYEMAWRKMGKVTPWGKGSFFKFDRVWPLVIFDECFPANTLVRIGEMAIPISSVQPGMMATTPCGPRRILRTIKRHGRFQLLKITHEGGSFECTPNHRIASPRGWIRADNLQVLRDEIFRRQELGSDLLLKKMQRILPREEKAEEPEHDPLAARPELCVKKNGFETNDEAQSDAEKVGQDEGKQKSEENWPSSSNSRRQRTPATRAATDATACLGQRLENRIQDFSTALADHLGALAIIRSGAARLENRGGVRRIRASVRRSEGSRSQEATHCRISRMDAASLQERTHHDCDGEGCLGNISRVLRVEPSRIVTEVYDLEVEDEHVYYADGVLVSNCHRTAGETTLNSKLLIAAKRQGSRILSLSATAADSVMKFRSLGFILGLHSLTNYRDWLASYGVVAIEFELRDGRKVKKLVISKGNNANAMRRLHDQIYGDRGSRMRIADIPDFPKTQIEVRTFSDAPKEVLRLDEEMRKFHTNRQALGAISSEEQGKLVYMRQAFETAKVPLLLDMTEDALETSRVAIFVNFTVTLEQLIVQAKKRKWTVGWIRGDQDPAERQKFIDDFQANKLDVIVCNIQAGGVGVSLHDPVTQVPRTAILCPTWSATDLKQALGRVHRDGGGTSRQFIVFFENCVEERVAKSVEKKLNNLSLLNDQELAGELADEPQAALPL